MHRIVLAAVILMALANPAAAQPQFHVQYGAIANPLSGQAEESTILTFQHALAWSLGDSFIFIDFTHDGVVDGFNDRSFYGEWYPTLSSGKLTTRLVGAGPLRDVAFRRRC